MNSIDMPTFYTTRFATDPESFSQWSTEKIRKEMLLNSLFSHDSIQWVYTHYDRMMVGGAMPGSSPLVLDPVDPQKADFFLQRRELGIINIGGPGAVRVDGDIHTLHAHDALYVGQGTESVEFLEGDGDSPCYYLNSTPAHCSYPTETVSKEDAETVELGSLEESNHRVIHKYLVHSRVETCQLQMGMTTLMTGSVWNTMPAHIHDRRMEAYLYLNLPDESVVCHFLGTPEETRHIWVQNRQAVLSPPWSIHSGAGTRSYSFIWGMGGENLDYGDMDVIEPNQLR
ncbi:MAG: 5-dehydro-4-deoxy-D-glucuronate isomerase [Balneolaceae bacterium]